MRTAALPPDAAETRPKLMRTASPPQDAAVPQPELATFSQNRCTSQLSHLGVHRTLTPQPEPPSETNINYVRKVTNYPFHHKKLSM